MDRGIFLYQDMSQLLKGNHRMPVIWLSPRKGGVKRKITSSDEEVIFGLLQ